MPRPSAQADIVLVSSDQLEEQLRDRLQMIGAGLGALVHDQTLGAQARDEAPRIARMLRSDDESEVADIVIDLACAGVIPDDPPAEWWRTPLGLIVARSTWREHSDAVTHSEAAAMLGVHRGQIGALVQRGKLDRHPDGGVTRGSVLARLAG